MEENFFVRLWNRMIYKLNVLLGEEPDDMLLQQQANSYQKGLDRSFKLLSKSGGRLGETLGVLATNKSKFNGAKNELDRLLPESQGMQPGPEKTLKDQQIQLKAKMVAGYENIVATIESGIQQSRQNQNMGELDFEAMSGQRDLANAEASMQVDRAQFARMRKEIAEAHLASEGIIQGASAIKDNRGILRRHADRLEGEADAESRMATSITGHGVNTMALSESEQAVLDDAKRRAGIAPDTVESKSDSAS